MKRHIVLMCAGAALVSAGCAHAPGKPAVAPVIHAPAGGLIFDVFPAPVSAEVYASRATPRTAPAFSSTGEGIYYRESYYDFQGPQPWGRDLLIRRFRQIREGFGIR